HDGIAFAGVAPAHDLAATIAGTILRRPLADIDAWSYANLAEAHLALEDVDASRRWLRFYVAAAADDPFALAATYRQLVEIWRAEDPGSPAAAVLSILAGALFIDGAELHPRVAVNVPVPRAPELRHLEAGQLEALFGSARPRPLSWLAAGIARARTVARVRDANGTFIGTGVLVDGAQLHERLTGRALLLTNYHVVN